MLIRIICSLCPSFPSLPLWFLMCCKGLITGNQLERKTDLFNDLLKASGSISHCHYKYHTVDGFRVTSLGNSTVLKWKNGHRPLHTNSVTDLDLNFSYKHKWFYSDSFLNDFYCVHSLHCCKLLLQSNLGHIFNKFDGNKLQFWGHWSEKQSNTEFGQRQRNADLQVFLCLKSQSPVGGTQHHSVYLTSNEIKMN